MEEKERRVWLAGLKEGDMVVYDQSYTSKPDYVVVKIERITPSGRITTTGGQKWKSDGSRQIDSWRWFRLYPLTPDIEASIEREKRKAVIRKVNLDKLSDEDIKTIYEIVTRKKEEKP
jgi:hypothetical protein